MYISVDEYLKRSYSSETERLSNEDGVVDEEINASEDSVVTLCIIDASSLVDSYLRSRYILPLADIPEVIKRIAFQVARFYLFEKKNVLTEDAFLIYDRALAELKRIQKGEVILALPLLSNEHSSGEISFTKGKRLDLGGY